jgi:hypothetical protein
MSLTDDWTLLDSSVRSAVEEMNRRQPDCPINVGYLCPTGACYLMNSKRAPKVMYGFDSASGVLTIQVSEGKERRWSYSESWKSVGQKLWLSSEGASSSTDSLADRICLIAAGVICGRPPAC